MNKSRFVDIVKDPGRILKKDLIQIEEISSQFPYSQVLHILEAKGSAIWNPKEAQQALHTAAAYCRDRGLLKDVMEDRHLQSETAAVTSEDTKELSTDEVVTEETASFDWIEEEETIQEEATPVEESAIDSEAAQVKETDALQDEETIAEADTPADPEDSLETSALEHDQEDETDAELEDELEDIEESLESALESLEASSPEPLETAESTALEESQPIPAKEDQETDSDLTEATEDEPSSEESVIKSFTSDEPAQEMTEDLLEKQIQQELQDTSIHSELMANLSQLKQSRQQFTDTGEQSESGSENEEQTAAEGEVIENGNRSEQIEIIDNFIKNSPVLSKPNLSADSEATNQKDLSKKSTTFNEKIATEQLAKIMVKQGNRKEAIKIYKKLITKFPKKKSYFADQIETLSK